MHLFRRIIPGAVLIFLALVAGLPLFAYPVSVTISVTFSEKLKNGATSAVITTTLDSATGTGSSATYTPLTPVEVTLSGTSCIGCGTAIPNTGTLTVNTNGTLTANFSDVNSSGTVIDSFSATLVTGLSQSTPSIYSFGTTTIANTSSATYNLYLLGGGTVGVSGSITAVGLTASPLSGLSASAVQSGTAPASQHVSVTSTDTSNPSQAFTATVSPVSATWLTLTGASGTTNGTTAQTVTANFSTNLSPGTYNASILIDTTTNSGAPISIPVTYAVSRTRDPDPNHRQPESEFGHSRQRSVHTHSQRIKLSVRSGRLFQRHCAHDDIRQRESGDGDGSG